jgi:hypothetical protein
LLQYPNDLWPLHLCNITRSVSFNFKTGIDHFYLVLIIQLFLQGFFASSGINKLSIKSKIKPFCLIIGPQALNPYYSKKTITNLNEIFFKNLLKQSINYKLTHKDYSLERVD